MPKKEPSKKIHLKNVRISFPSIFQKETFEGKETKYAATFLIPKSDVKTKKIIDAAIADAMADAKVAKVSSDRRCIQDGDDSDYDSNHGCWSIKASSNKRPTVIDRDKTQLTQEDEKIYGGCRVNAIIDIWVQNNSYGKRVNANLYGVQFVKDDEPFGMGAIDVTDEFDDIDDSGNDGEDI